MYVYNTVRKQNINKLIILFSEKSLYGTNDKDV